MNLGFSEDKFSAKNSTNFAGGFTLIELVLVITLLAISAGVSSDIIISLIRSYNKTQITNELEQSANFVYLKIEKELRNSIDITEPASGSSSDTLSFTDSDGITTITYSLSSNQITRDGVPITDVSATGGGVSVACPGNCFTMVNTNPDVLRISMVFSNPSAVGGTLFSGSVTLDDTIVLRGSY